VERTKTTAKAIRKIVAANNYHVSARDVIFKNLDTDKGVLVKMLDMWYAQRKLDKKEEKKFRSAAIKLFDEASTENNGGVAVTESGVTKYFTKENHEAYEENMRMSGIHFNLQWSCKILLNSIYGCLASKYFRFYGQELAESITMSGRKIIKANGKMLNDFFNNEFFDMKIVKKNFTIDESIGDVECRLYTDTDSQIFSTNIRTNKGIYQIGDLYNLYENKNKHYSQYGHEIVDVDDEDLQCFTYNEKTQKAEMGKIKKLIRHKVTKKKWRIRVNGKEVIVTEDHCAMVKRNGELLRVKPKEIIKGDKILTIF
jgi:DNA polymerase elongation subunit (family B)